MIISPKLLTVKSQIGNIRAPSFGFSRRNDGRRFIIHLDGLGLYRYAVYLYRFRERVKQTQLYRFRVVSGSSDAEIYVTLRRENSTTWSNFHFQRDHQYFLCNIQPYSGRKCLKSLNIIRYSFKVVLLFVTSTLT